jgi:hypothetical protein
VTAQVVLLALSASVFTALASVAQRRAAAPAPGELSFSWRLFTYLLRRPMWFLGIASLTLGFVSQVLALRFGSLTVVQPVIATELLIVFAFVAAQHPRATWRREWLSALGMVVGIGGFLALAQPTAGGRHPSAVVWVLAGVCTTFVAVALTFAAGAPRSQGRATSPNRKAALLGVAAATEFGFVAAVTKEFSAHLTLGLAGIFENWSPYVLVVTGIAAMYLASNAFQAGSLAASQPGLTIVDPLVASFLGVYLFGDRLDLSPWHLVGELTALGILVISVVVLSQSALIKGESTETPTDSGGTRT